MIDSAPGSVPASASVGRGAAILVVGSLCFAAFGFAARITIARGFGVSAWGNFSLGLAFVQLLVVVSILGLHQAVARTLAFEREVQARRAVIRWGVLLTITSGGMVSTLVFVFSGPIAGAFVGNAGGQLRQVMEWLAPTIGLTLTILLLGAIFQGFEDAGPNALFNFIAAPVLFLGLVLLFLFLRVGFVGALAAYLCSATVAASAFAIYTWRRLPTLLPASPKVRLPFPRDLGKLAIALWGATSLAFLTGYADTLILGLFRPSSIVGLYTGATTLARLMVVAGLNVAYIFLPVSARLARSADWGTLQKSYVTATRWMVGLTLPLVLLFGLEPSSWLHLVYGSGFIPAAATLSVLVSGVFASTACGPISACLAGMGQGRAVFSVSAISASANIALSFLLIPTFGLIGAAWAWTLARLVFGAAGSVALWRVGAITSLRRPLTLPLAITLLVAVPAFAVLALVHLPWWGLMGSALAAIFAFPAISLTTHSLERDDLILVRATERVLGRPLPSLRRWLTRFT